MNVGATGLTFGYASTTATAGTRFQRLIPPKGKNRRTKITKLQYRSGSTAQTLTAMTPLAKTTAYATAAASATSLLLTRDPGSYAANAIADGLPVPSVADNLIATNDWLVYQTADGNFYAVKITGASTSSGVVTCTVGALQAGGVKVGAPVWFFGIITDTNPQTGEAHPLFLPPTSATTAYGDGASALVQTARENEPILLDSDNATAQSWLDYVSGVYSA